MATARSVLRVSVAPAVILADVGIALAFHLIDKVGIETVLT